MSSPANSTNMIPWTRFQPAPHECPSCSLCTSNEDCPASTHPFNYEGHTGLRCYMCSACSHETYKRKDGPQDAPKPYKYPGDRFYTDKYTWYVHVPIDEKCNSDVFKYRVVLAEMQNAKVTIYQSTKLEEDPLPEHGLVIPVGMRETTPMDIVMEEAREQVRSYLRRLRHVYEFEMDLGARN
ncbi:hypothetical protein BJX61DRAFT_165921 [Aspergillus egyptiacus]|nr:hypothetical protein BJX61DRAFT_165921 [Aspergillus egyptiacus]